ncbi:MAG TPA: class I adenylate-forming enzyme family protein [Candidatus Binatia bacterium]|nr:class I adenylate-forming enzyme family protein [Candidatus Binatia bacterium]
MDAAPTLARLLDDALERRPDEPAVVCGDHATSFAELRELSLRLAGAFAAAGLRGERVATLLPNGVELLACQLGCWAAGAIAVPFEYVDAPPEIAYGLADSGARWLLVHEEKLGDLDRVDLAQTSVAAVFVVGTPRAGERRFAELAATAPSRAIESAGDAPAFILYTSGSTALPKGVVHTHASAAGIIASVLSALAPVDERSRMVVHDSVSHMGGWIEAYPLLWRGATIVLERDFEANRFYADLRRHRPTIVGAHVDHLWQIVRHPGAARADFASVATVFTGGDELPLPLQRAFLDLTGLPIQVGWGMTEAIWLTIARTPELRRRGFLGRPVDAVEIRIVDAAGRDVVAGEAGELWVRGPMVAAGYWNRPEADRAVFAPGGWLRTGDMGLRDPAGDYWFTGRVKNIIVRSSENVTPGEIEQALYRHPAVAEAAAFGVSDPDEGQVPIAYVSLAPGRNATEEELKAFLETQIAVFKVPARILAIDAMPLTHSGKIDHHALERRFAEAAGRA